jgi:predicted transcriptional regulator
MKPVSKQDTTTVRLPRALVDEMHEIAEAHERTLSAELRVALGDYVRREAPGARRALRRRKPEERA